MPNELNALFNIMLELKKHKQTDEFLNQTNTSKMEDIRKELEPLKLYGEEKYWNDPDYLFDWTDGEFMQRE